MRSFMSAFQRVVLLVLLVALGTWLFYIGREHQIFLDNKSIERDGQNFRALAQVNVSVNGGPTLELFPRDREIARVVGPDFTLKVEVLDSLGGDVEKTFELEMRPEFDKDLMISLPLLAAGRDDYVLPAPGARAAAEDDDAGATAP